MSPGPTSEKHSETAAVTIGIQSLIRNVVTEVTKVSIIVPTFQEAQNIEPLTERAFSVLKNASLDGEILFVDDDSRDGSVEIVEQLGSSLPVRILVRTDERGLSSAVLHGFRHAANDVLVVMDADLQHPPEAIPSLVEAVTTGGADIAVGSRYVSGGSIQGEWSLLRHLNSVGATWLARPLISLRDPMSGFCAIKKDIWKRAAELNPIGYKIVLELAVKARCKNCVEIPIQFATRQAGESKLSLKEQMLYLRHLARLYWFKFGLGLLIPLAAIAVAVFWIIVPG